jgi:hypothetical protein
MPRRRLAIANNILCRLTRRSQYVGALATYLAMDRAGGGQALLHAPQLAGDYVLFWSHDVGIVEVS